MKMEELKSASQLNRRGFMRLVAMTSGAVAASLASGRFAWTAAKTPGKINAAFFVETKPTMIAKGEGWFEKMGGAKFNWSEVGSGAEINTGMAAGSFDVAFAIGSSPTAAGISQGIAYEVVAMVDNIGPAEDMVVRKAANIKSPADFKGKKVATPFGSTSHFRVLGFLKLNNLSERDVTVLDMNPDAEVAAWHRGDIDAAYVWSPAKAKMLEGGGELFSTYKELDAHGYVIADLIVARTAFLQEYPAAVAGIVKAYGRAVDLWKTKPDEATAIVAKQAGVTEAVAKHDLSEYDFVSLKDQLSPAWLGTPGKPGKFAEVLKGTADFLVQQKSIRSAPSVSAFQKAINTRFIEQALKG
jgi:taurine transport system substrate-binding protein